MGAREVLDIGHPILRQKARDVGADELSSPAIQSLIDDLIATMRAKNGAGLAANQIGELVRICVIEVKDNPRYPYKPNIPLTVLVNPIITPLAAETFASYEGCLSVPNLRGVVNRHVAVRVTALDRFGEAIDLSVRGLSAGTYQHEVDHLDGVLFVDRVVDTRTLCTWQTFDRYFRDDFVREAEALVAREGS
ncbi:MAG TPA: peptide deformylase [Kofleriaceae bacterium]|nr:peptide deformylase [Kofleriaceae bacterium]